MPSESSLHQSPTRILKTLMNMRRNVIDFEQGLRPGLPSTAPGFLEILLEALREESTSRAKSMHMEPYFSKVNAHARARAHTNTCGQP